jgi:hypothetical protein
MSKKNKNRGPKHWLGKRPGKGWIDYQDWEKRKESSYKMEIKYDQVKALAPVLFIFIFDPWVWYAWFKPTLFVF